jgi:hypothetical protein
MTKTEITQEVDRIKNQLIEKYRPEKIILFDSAAWGHGEEVKIPHILTPALLFIGPLITQGRRL